MCFYVFYSQQQQQPQKLSIFPKKSQYKTLLPLAMPKRQTHHYTYK